MTFGIIHVTDMHLECGGTGIEQRFDELRNYALKKAAQTSTLLWLLTGDIAYHGSSSEYELFSKCFEALMKSVKARFPSVTHKMYAVPGNHDCDFKNSAEEDERSNILKSSRTPQIILTAEQIGECLAIQSTFFESMAKLGIKTSNALCGEDTFKIGEKTIEMILVNSAWTSSEKEKYGSLALPSEVVNRIKHANSADIKIVICHHPVSWFDSNTQRTFREAIEQPGTICFFGHEHEPDSRNIIPAKLSQHLATLSPSLVIDGGLFYSKKSQSSSLNFVGVNYDTGELSISVVKLVDNEFVEQESTLRPFCGSRVTEFQKSKLKDATLSWLDEHEIQLFKQDWASPPTIQQLYVYPNFEDIAAKKTTKSIDSALQSALVINNGGDVYFISGGEKSGKTALIKNYYMELVKSGRTPIYITGSDIKRFDRASVSRAIEKRFREQYSVSKNASCFALPKDTLYLFIDDFEQEEITDENLALLFTSLIELCPKIILAGNTVFRLEGAPAAVIQSASKVAHFYRIKDFGNAKRDELVHAWLRLNRPVDITDEELTPEAEILRKSLNEIICDDVVPKTPFFLLTVLQGLSNKQTSDLSTSSHGAYYEYLIVNGLLKAELKREEMGKYHSVFTELAFKLLSLGKTSVNEHDLERFFTENKNEFELQLEYEAFKRVALRARILGPRDGLYCFFYSYQFLFYSGRSLAMRLDKPGGHELFEKLLDRTYNSDIANIILFVAYFTRHKYVTDELIKRCKLIFSATVPLRFESDISDINSLANLSPQKIVPKPTREARQGRLEQMDVAEAQIEEEEQDNIYSHRDEQLLIAFKGDKTLEKLTKFEKATVAQKFVEIIGQALRNNHSDIQKKEKTVIVQEVALLSLRTAKFIIDDVKAHFGLYVSMFAHGVKPEDKEAFESMVLKSAFGYFTIISMSFVRLFSRSLASPELKDTFRRIFKDEVWTCECFGDGFNEAFNNAKSVLFTTLRLENGELPPISELRETFKMLDGNTLTTNVLRHCIIEFQELYPVSISDKQKISALLSVEVKTQELISRFNDRKI